MQAASAAANPCRQARSSSETDARLSEMAVPESTSSSKRTAEASASTSRAAEASLAGSRKKLKHQLHQQAVVMQLQAAAKSV